MQSCLFFSVKMFFDSFKSSLLAQTISCSVFNEINKKKSTLYGVFIMTHSFPWFLQIPSPSTQEVHGFLQALPGPLPRPSLGGCLLACLSEVESHSEGAGESHIRM